MASSSDYAVTDCSARLASRNSTALELLGAKEAPSGAAARSVAAIFVCAVENCPGVAAFQPAIGSPGAVANERNAVAPSALASTNDALVNADTCGCGAVATVAGETDKSICCRHMLHPEVPLS